jgi:hypothetical protein
MAKPELSAVQRTLRRLKADPAFVQRVGGRSLIEAWTACVNPAWMIWLLAVHADNDQDDWPTVREVIDFVYLTIAYGVEGLDHGAHTLGERMIDDLAALRRTKSEPHRLRFHVRLENSAQRLSLLAMATRIFAEIVDAPKLGAQGAKRLAEVATMITKEIPGDRLPVAVTFCNMLRRVFTPPTSLIF